MTTTQLTLLKLKPGATTLDRHLREKLGKVRGILEAAADSDRCFYWYQQTEDPSYLYIIREGGPATEHRGESAPFELDESLLELLGADFDLSKAKTFHVDLPLRDIPVDAPLISIGQHKVPRGNKEAFEKRFSDTRHLMDEYVTREKKGAGGWRIEKDAEDHEEWVLFIGWESWEQHFNFVKIEAFKEYGKILRLLSGYDSRHAKLIDLG
jgi:heme-degrading monooxygenase HmoA